MDKDALLSSSRLPQAKVDLVDGTVTVRGLSRGEIIGVQQFSDDLPALEKAILHYGMVDPPLTPDEVARWYQVATHEEVEQILETIRDLSGLGEGSAKAIYKSVRREP